MDGFHHQQESCHRTAGIGPVSLRGNLGSILEQGGGDSGDPQVAHPLQAHEGAEGGGEGEGGAGVAAGEPGAHRRAHPLTPPHADTGRLLGAAEGFRGDDFWYLSKFGRKKLQMIIMDRRCSGTLNWKFNQCAMCLKPASTSSPRVLHPGR